MSWCAFLSIACLQSTKTVLLGPCSPVLNILVSHRRSVNTCIHCHIDVPFASTSISRLSVLHCWVLIHLLDNERWAAGGCTADAHIRTEERWKWTETWVNENVSLRTLPCFSLSGPQREPRASPVVNERTNTHTQPPANTHTYRHEASSRVDTRHNAYFALCIDMWINWAHYCRFKPIY